jgi:hypothetical protein
MIKYHKIDAPVVPAGEARYKISSQEYLEFRVTKGIV